MSTLDDWTDALCAELGLDPEDINQKTVLNLARVAAHTVDRPAAPLTAYALGVAVGRGQPLAKPPRNSSSLPAAGQLTTDRHRSRQYAGHRADINVLAARELPLPDGNRPPAPSMRQDTSGRRAAADHATLHNAHYRHCAAPQADGRFATSPTGRSVHVGFSLDLGPRERRC